MALNLCFPLIPLSSTHSNLKGLPSLKPQIKKFTTTARASDRRSSEVYQPNIWDYHNLQSLMSNPMDESDSTQRIEALKKKVRHMIDEEKEVSDHLELIDALRKLGVAYHFEEEIKVILGSMPVSSENVRMLLKDDLHYTALLFRLLREYGSFVSQDVFDGFKDEKGNFKVSLCDNTKGMLSLYEASYYSVKGEDTLDEARAFTTKHLQCLMDQGSLDPCVREHVAHALELPLNWRTSRLDARWFICNVYERAKDSNTLLIEFSKRDFNLVQGIYQTELKELVRWWTSLGFHESLSFARDRLIECYVFAIGWASEPRFWRYREALTKFNMILTTIDDVYDAYGSMKELELFSDAVERWDTDAIEQLPDYMKICYLALLNSVNEVAYDVLKEKGLDITQHLKKGWGIQCNSYLKEAKWIQSQHIPTFEEYMDNGWISISSPLAQIYSYYLMSHKITHEATECLKSRENVVCHSAMIFRLLNDLVTSTDEVNRGDVQKSIQCLMYERGVTEVVARENIMDMVRDLWKELNGDRFATPFEEPYLSTSINFARVAHYMYQDKDRFGKPDLDCKDHAMLLLIEPISLNV